MKTYTPEFYVDYHDNKLTHIHNVYSWLEDTGNLAVGGKISYRGADLMIRARSHSKPLLEVSVLGDIWANGDFGSLAGKSCFWTVGFMRFSEGVPFLCREPIERLAVFGIAEPFSYAYETSTTRTKRTVLGTIATQLNARLSEHFYGFYDGPNPWRMSRKEEAILPASWLPTDDIAAIARARYRIFVYEDPAQEEVLVKNGRLETTTTSWTYKSRRAYRITKVYHAES